MRTHIIRLIYDVHMILGWGMRIATSACAEALLIRTHFIWSKYDVHMILGLGYAYSDQRMCRGATYAHSCYLVNIFFYIYSWNVGIRRATAAYTEALLMRTDVVLLIYGIYMLVFIVAKGTRYLKIVEVQESLG